MVGFFEDLESPAVWELRVQLCRDLARMPTEDASVEWPEELSPHLPVAKLTLERQIAWDHVSSQDQEDRPSFAPRHALDAHRPLGALNRASREVMAASRRFRSDFNGCPLHEPGAFGSAWRRCVCLLGRANSF